MGTVEYRAPNSQLGVTGRRRPFQAIAEVTALNSRPVATAVTTNTRHRRSCVATGLVFAAFTSAFAWNGAHSQVTVAVEHGARYSTVPILLLDAALIVAADAYAHRWWPRPKAIVAVAALVAVLAASWAADFRYPVRRLSGPHAAWEHTAGAWLGQCQHRPTGTITVTFRNWWGPARLATTFSCSSLRR